MNGSIRFMKACLAPLAGMTTVVISLPLADVSRFWLVDECFDYADHTSCVNNARLMM